MTEPAKTTGPAKLSPAERRRRRARRAWIPTGIIAILIVAAVIVALVLQRGGGSKAVVEVAGDSTFDKAGITEIAKTADAQIDVRGPRDASALGLPANGSKKIGPFLNIAAELDLVGTSGTESLFVDSFKVVTKNNYLTAVTTSTRVYDYTDLHNDLVSDSDIGITTTQMAAFVNAMPDGAAGPSSYFTLALGTGNALGVPTRVVVKCSGPDGCLITTTTTLHHP